MTGVFTNLGHQCRRHSDGRQPSLVHFAYLKASNRMFPQATITPPHPTAKLPSRSPA